MFTGVSVSANNFFVNVLSLYFIYSTLIHVWYKKRRPAVNSRPSAYSKVISRLFTHRIPICATTMLCLLNASYLLCVGFFLSSCSLGLCSCLFSSNSRSSFPHRWPFQLCLNRFLASGISVRISPDFPSFRFLISFSHGICDGNNNKVRMFYKNSTQKKPWSPHNYPIMTISSVTRSLLFRFQVCTSYPLQPD